MHNVICPYCNQNAECVRTTEIYPKDYGWMYLCRPCDAWVGCHKQSKRPYGRLANKELREAKKEAHKWFDKLWKEFGFTRSGAYTWLSKCLNIQKRDCHIGMFNIEMCKETVRLCMKRCA